MADKHTHDMKPDRPVKPTVYRCSSCAFACTPSVVSRVKANPSQHRRVKRPADGITRVWDGS